MKYVALLASTLASLNNDVNGFVPSSFGGLSKLNSSTKQIFSTDGSLQVASSETALKETSEILEDVDTYARCGRCGANFQLTSGVFGGAKGKRLQCSVCDHVWFQAADKLFSLKDGMEFSSYPEYEIEMAKTKIKAGRRAFDQGDGKLFVGNLSYDTTEKDLYELFAEVGPLGDIRLIKDEFGRSKGFAFLSYLNEEDGEKAMDILDGKDVGGRPLSVSTPNN